MKDHKDYESQVELVMEIIDELIQSYELINKPDSKNVNTLPIGAYGKTNKDGSKTKQSLGWSLSITKPTRSEIENFVKSRLLKYKFSWYLIQFENLL